MAQVSGKQQFSPPFPRKRVIFLYVQTVSFTHKKLKAVFFFFGNVKRSTINKFKYDKYNRIGFFILF